MFRGDLEVKSNKLIASDTFEIVLQGNVVQQISRPGQFVHIKIGEGSTHMLRRPFSIADYNIKANQLTIIYKLIGDGTEWLSHRRTGENLNVLGPLGNGFEVEGIKDEHILVIGGGVGVPPLYNLVKQLSTQNHVTAILGYQSKDAIFYEQKFSRFADTFIATNDGSYGYKGFVTDVIDQMGVKFDQYYACGPLGMLGAVQQRLIDVDGYLSIEERMGCGVGACFACVCPAFNEKGYVKICQDGPVFHSKEVTL
ncbi:dihydroorotate dehydrogenase electron transfer subunit [Piscibacillus halophilus]|uniref:dihydroorotate dehydrogenase electron transfer subunit n=1 Tax=Piscibacillus halophilus TaxID=571933 RepID=UPI00158D22AB|nr:dihydroorotate dehydrogenase electron transfer subunit [Piscibacillus halophilus]